jgi:hypothetical protein
MVPRTFVAPRRPIPRTDLTGGIYSKRLEIRRSEQASIRAEVTYAIGTTEFSITGKIVPQTALR